MELNAWLADTLNKTEAKIAAVCERLGDKIPYIPIDGRYVDQGEQNISWWTNGFWGGIMWQLYHVTGKEIYRKSAEKHEDRLDLAFSDFIGLHHDVGFMYLYTAVANFKLTSSEMSRKRGLHAANILAGRYNSAAKYIVAWDYDAKGWMIIDTMMNLPLLYWASKEAKKPHYEYIARSHADAVIDKLLRPDGSSGHIAILDHSTGHVLENMGGQGYGQGSSWSRGQAWALYGFALSYVHSKNEMYLDIAKRTANYFIANTSHSGYIPLCDFRAPKGSALYDTTAGCIAACGLLEIADNVNEHEKHIYKDAAIDIIMAMTNKFADFDIKTDGIMGGGTTSYNDKSGHHVNIIYGDYFFLEAVLRLLEKDNAIYKEI